jgi:hypothetical protein
MFDWLEQEIGAIKTRRFHVVDGLADAALRGAFEASGVALPRSYKEFVLRFGNAKLYRKLDYYKVGVMAPKEVVEKTTGEPLYLIGHHDSSSAYFKKSLLSGEEEAPVFEGRGGKLVQVADGFEEWLRKRCKAARAKYAKREWAEVLAGPQPFTPEERAVVEARRSFTCRLAGVTPAGGMLFEVHNGSGAVLPYLSVGVRWEGVHGGRLQGGVWVPVAHIHPGQTAVVEHDAYDGMADPGKAEVFVLPDPEPEDRDRYWEFKALAR